MSKEKGVNGVTCCTVLTFTGELESDINIQGQLIKYS